MARRAPAKLRRPDARWGCAGKASRVGCGRGGWSCGAREWGRAGGGKVGPRGGGVAGGRRGRRSVTLGGAPRGTRPLQGPNFQQQASLNYTATVVHPQGSIPVIGTFTELLNTSTGRSAFVDFRQDSSATTQAAGEGAAMIASLQ
nr:hypothetical protein [Mycobacterium avium]